VLGFGTDLASWPAFSRRSLGAAVTSAGPIAQNPTEENSYLGWPLLLALPVLMVLLRRRAVAWALAGTAALFAVLSFGRDIVVNGRRSGVKGPWALLDRLPLLDSVVPTRLALVVAPIVGCLIALALTHLSTSPQRRRLRWAVGAATVAVLIPLIPTPLPTRDRPPVPRFFATGSFRPYVTADGSVLGVPPHETINVETMRWQTATNLAFANYGGYFLAPDRAAQHRRANFGRPWPQLWFVVFEASRTGVPITVAEDDRARILGELRERRVSSIVLPASQSQAEVTRTTLDGLLGPGRNVDDVWVWRVPG
jgi:hypothetical protein